MRRTLMQIELVTVNFTPAYFSQLQDLKVQERLIVFKEDHRARVSAAEYLHYDLVVPVQEALRDLKQVRPRSDTRELIKACRLVLELGEQVFEKDYKYVARLIDAGRPQMQIDSQVVRIFERNGPRLEVRLRALKQAALPFAEDHGIEIQRTLPR
ncbi:hypothetical protein GCM10027051_13260 [Niabella terrae]